MTTSTPPAQLPGPVFPVLFLAFVFAALFTVLNWLQAGLPFAADPIHSTDDMVRMVMVRDWLNGQSWFDLKLYRLGPAGGTLMHWSRLVDLPIGLLVMAGNALGLDGERVSMVVWPFMMMVVAFAAVITAVSRASGGLKAVPLLVISGFALAASGVFDSGFIDHHNVQLALTLWLIALLTPNGANPKRDMAIAGVLTAIMLAIGIEALPFAIAGSLAIYARLVVEKDRFIPAARVYGLALALTAAALFVFLVSPANYTAVYCDAFSTFHLVNAGLGGMVLWLGFYPKLMTRLQCPQWSVPLFAAALVIIATAVFFPDCLGDPSVMSEPKLKTFWFDGVVETQNLFRIAKLDPWLLPYMHILPLLALGFGGRAAMREFPRSPFNTVLIFAAIAFAVSLYQYRGIQYAAPIAALVLTILVTRFAMNGAEQRPLVFLGAIALSCTLVWKVLVQAAIALVPSASPGPMMQAAQAGPQAGCQNPALIASLEAEPKGVVAAANSLGSALLYYSGHHILAGPYHRNIEGNLAWINAMTGTAEEARAIFAKQGVTVLAICPSDADERDFVKAAPQGFTAQLLAGSIPSWLEPVAATQATPLKLFRVKP